MKAKKKLTLIDKILLWINIFFSIGLLLSYLSPITNPGKFWLFAFFGLAYPGLILANAIMVIYWLLRKSRWVLLPLICIGIGWGVLRTNIGLRFSTDTGPATRANNIRMMTYNVHAFKKYGSNNDAWTKHEILKIVEEEQPDIINFQEYYTRRKGQYDMNDSLKNIMKSDHYYFQQFFFNYSEAYGLAIFSKYPVVGQGMVQLSEITSENQCIYVDLKKGDRTFRVYNVHLQSVGFDEHDYQYLNRVSQQGKPSVRSTKRLGSKLKGAFLKRAEQVLKVKNNTATCPYPYIIAGDFNDTPMSFAVNEMCRGLKNAFREKGSGLCRTYNGDFPNFQIDYIMASPVFDVTSYKVIEKKLSDHYAVRSDLVLK